MYYGRLSNEYCGYDLDRTELHRCLLKKSRKISLLIHKKVTTEELMEYEYHPNRHRRHPNSNNPRYNNKDKNMYTNISKYTPSEREEKVLALGLNFNVTPREFNRRKLISCLNMNAHSVKNEIHEARISAVNYIGQNLFQEYCSRKPNDVGNNNINQDILKGIKSLRDNSEILIKKADKGNEPVLWDKEEYIHEGLRQLNSQNYEICKDTALIDAKMAVENLLTKYTSNNTITTETMHELNCRNATPGRMYFLPKTHKNEYPVKGRPIISTNNSPTEKLSKYIDNLMKPLLTKVPSMIRNSGDFLKKLQQIDKDKIFESFHSNHEQSHLSIPLCSMCECQ
ncbi:hypothetical protein GJ496_002176 [Pomphorhynchus laevis]|nr:hypothetical protein GJ496_002176 [Pomphorhynchus laevis]